MALVAVFTSYALENSRFGILTRRLPYVVSYAVTDYFSQNKLILKSAPKNLKTNVDSLQVVFILGESVRADHLQLNGYARETNPLLSKRKNIISFSNMYTSNTYTAASIPQILTNASLSDDYNQPKYSLIDILNQAHIQTTWIGNQTPEKSYEMFIKQSGFSKIIDPLHSELSFQKTYDEKLIPLFKSLYQPNQNQFTTIHMMGSHWWYETRYPASFRKFKPVIQSKNIPSNSTEEMINSYDNTLVYLDFFINEIIQEVEKQNTKALIIYLADHGELLVEDKLWLHVQRGKAAENPAMLIWYSNKFQKTHSEIIDRWDRNHTKKTDLDFFFPSLISLFDIEGIDYNKNKTL